MDDTTNPVDDALVEFAAENPELMEALKVFGIASSEYERALRALYPTVTYTGSSTGEPRG